jgi:8-hydroxy-5-deazaflavin:NADPH oxidoreductase
MRLGTLGTGVVGKTIAARLAGLGHDVMVGTHDPQETLSRTEPDPYGDPPIQCLAKGAPRSTARHVWRCGCPW